MGERLLHFWQDEEREMLFGSDGQDGSVKEDSLFEMEQDLGFCSTEHQNVISKEKTFHF